MNKKFYLLFSILIMIGIFLSCTGVHQADLVFMNGKVATMNDNMTMLEAVAIKGDHILLTGSNQDVQVCIGSTTKVIDLEGKLVLPGLIDAHAHFASYGAFLENLDLNGTTSYQQILDMVAERVKNVHRGEWIVGRGWDQNNWKNKKFPTLDALSKVAPENPVILTRTCGHAVLVNQKALDIAGITDETPNPPGGEILKKSNGKPSGILVDEAEELVRQHIPEMSPERFRETLVNAANDCLSKGLTGMHNAGTSLEQIEILKEMFSADKIGMRIYAMLADPKEGDFEKYLTENRIDNYQNHFLKVGCVKLFADGSLGARSAALLEPYSDDPENRGLTVATNDHIYEIAKAALKTNTQVAIHAIGDRAIRNVLDAYEKALKEHPREDHRFRIEHSQIIAKADLPRYKKLGVIPSMQPASAVSDYDWTESRIGKARLWGAFAFRRFFDDGNIIPCSSDSPVESNDPLRGIFRAVTRQDENGQPEGGWLPDQCMTVEEAVRGYTIWAAMAAFQEDILGTVKTGKLADLTILDQNIFEIEPKEILNTNVVYTVVGGKIRYSQE